ncbi:MAG: sulfite exporter TauE/SafE family protein [Bdellovibrionales bacterium]|nr:sulfite exporter TauE/SafE family protein [Bdellovibrionales bacterium]
MEIAKMLLVGIMTGLFSGFFGVGGGVVLIPLVTYFFALSPHQATGTSLLMLVAPIGLIGAIQFWNKGHINMDTARMVGFILPGVYLGSYFGSQFALAVSGPAVQRSFSLLLIFAGVKMFAKSLGY